MFKFGRKEVVLFVVIITTNFVRKMDGYLKNQTDR